MRVPLLKGPRTSHSLKPFLFVLILFIFGCVLLQQEQPVVNEETLVGVTPADIKILFDTHGTEAYYKQLDAKVSDADKDDTVLIFEQLPVGKADLLSPAGQRAARRELCWFDTEDKGNPTDPNSLYLCLEPRLKRWQNEGWEIYGIANPLTDRRQEKEIPTETGTYQISCGTCEGVHKMKVEDNWNPAQISKYCTNWRSKPAQRKAGLKGLEGPWADRVLAAMNAANKPNAIILTGGDHVAPLKLELMKRLKGIPALADTFTSIVTMHDVPPAERGEPGHCENQLQIVVHTGGAEQRPGQMVSLQTIPWVIDLNTVSDFLLNVPPEVLQAIGAKVLEGADFKPQLGIIDGRKRPQLAIMDAPKAKDEMQEENKSPPAGAAAEKRISMA